MSTAKPDKPKSKRRHYSPEFRLSVLKECEVPGSSIAEVARKHQLNANLVHKWRRDYQRSQTSQRNDFVALPVLATPAVQIGASVSIKVELLLLRIPLFCAGRYPKQVSWCVNGVGRIPPSDRVGY